MSGGAPAVDASGNIYVITGTNFGDYQPGYNNAFLKMTPGLSLADYFMPANTQTLINNDADLGSGGVVLLPDNSSSHPHELIGGGKDGRIFVIDRDAMGEFQSTDHVVQVVQEGTQQYNNMHCTPVYWNNNVYVHSASDVVRRYSWSASNELAGKVAVVIGASRGLGLAIKHALAVRSAEVYTIARSIADADSHRAIAGDAADLAAIMKLRERIVVEQGRLDFLVCNACPPIPSLRLEVNAVQRIEKYINEATSLTLTPLCAFLDLLNASSGCAVLISSQAVEQPVREWPHYLAAKQAVEMLGRIAVLQYPKTHVVAVRPPKLLTAMTNSPVSRSGASPAAFADRLVTHLEKPLEPGHFEFFS